LQSNSVTVIHRLRKTVSLLIQSLKSQRRTVVPERKQQNPLKIEKISSKSVTHINGQSAVDLKISLIERLLYGWQRSSVRLGAVFVHRSSPHTHRS
jgi:hypothetical protein